MIWLLNWRVWTAILLASGLAASHIAIYKAGKNSVQVEFDVYKMAAEMASKAAIEQARATEQRWNDKLNKERNHAAIREQTIRKDADRANAAADGLRDQLSATAHRIAESSPSACIAAIPAYNELLGDCSVKYIDMAEKADRHSSDVKTLIESWPN